MIFSQMLKKLMLSNNISNYKLAKELGISQSTVANWLSGKTAPSTTRINELAQYFNTTTSYLLNGTPPGSDPAAGTSFAEPQISKDLMAIIKYYNELSGDGQAKALEYIEMLRDRERKGYKNGKKNKSKSGLGTLILVLFIIAAVDSFIRNHKILFIIFIAIACIVVIYRIAVRYSKSRRSKGAWTVETTESNTK